MGAMEVGAGEAFDCSLYSRRQDEESDSNVIVICSFAAIKVYTIHRLFSQHHKEGVCRTQNLPEDGKRRVSRQMHTFS